MTARAQKVVWDLGDGTEVSCGKGTEWTYGVGEKPSPTCGHTYSKQGRYTVRATSHWVGGLVGLWPVGVVQLRADQVAASRCGRVAGDRDERPVGRAEGDRGTAVIEVTEKQHRHRAAPAANESGPVPRSPKLSRRPFLVVLAAVLVVAGAVAGGLLWVSATAAGEVVMVRQDVSRGEVITAAGFGHGPGRGRPVAVDGAGQRVGRPWSGSGLPRT